MLYRTGSILVAVAILASTAFAIPAFAAKGGGGKTTGGYGSCSVAGPVPVGGQYTVLGQGFKANELLNVYVQDSHGTQAFMLSADSSGAFSVSSYASWTGTDTVTVYDNSGRRMVYLTTCPFQVV